VNLESKEKLVEIIKQARGSISQRAFSKLLGVSATAVQLWEKGVNIPNTEYLAQIAPRAGYTLEELLNCLEGKPVQQASDLSIILRQINHLPLSQVAQVMTAAANRLAAAIESSSDELKAS